MKIHDLIMEGMVTVVSRIIRKREISERYEDDKKNKGDIDPVFAIELQKRKDKERNNDVKKTVLSSNVIEIGKVKEKSKDAEEGYKTESVSKIQKKQETNTNQCNIVYKG